MQSNTTGRTIPGRAVVRGVPDSLRNRYAFLQTAGAEQVLDQAAHPVEREGEDDGQQTSGDQHRRALELDAVVDDVAEPAGVDERGERGDTDGQDEGGPDTGQDDGNGQR